MENEISIELAGTWINPTKLSAAIEQELRIGRAQKLIEALNEQVPPGKVLNWALQVAILRQAGLG